MKRVLWFTLMGLLVFSTPLWAASAFGVKGGLNLANIAEDPKGEGVSYGIRTGIMVGGSVEIPLTPTNKLTLRSEALYAMKGSKISGSIGGVDVKSTIQVDELVVAPFLVFRFPSQGFTPFLQFGPELGLNVTHKAKSEATANGQSASETTDLTDWASTNFGLNLGAGAAIPAGRGEVLFDVRYNLGLANMYTGAGSLTDKTNGIQILIGYNFTVPKK
jgi:hypothetical protein